MAQLFSELFQQSVLLLSVLVAWAILHIEAGVPLKEINHLVLQFTLHIFIIVILSNIINCLISCLMNCLMVWLGLLLFRSSWSMSFS